MIASRLLKNKKPSSNHSLRAFLWVESGEVISGFFNCWPVRWFAAKPVRLILR